MISWLALLLHTDADSLRLITALLGLITATATSTGTVIGLLNRARTKRTEAAAVSTNAAIVGLVALLTEQKQERAQLWAAYTAATDLVDPEEVRRIAGLTAEERAREVLTPVHRFFAAVELVESRREHRPETDIIEILRQELAAA